MYTIDLHWIEKTNANKSLDDLCAGVRELTDDNYHAEAFCAVACWCAAHTCDYHGGANSPTVYRAFAQAICALDTLNQALGYNRTSGELYPTISGYLRLDLLHVKIKADFYGSDVYERICAAL